VQPAPAPSVNTRGNQIVGRAVPRADRPVVVAPRADQRYVRGYDQYRRVYPAPRYVYPSPVYVRPYVFRPRTRLSLGLFLGYPVPYTYSYGYAIPVYGYGAPRAPVVVAPRSPSYGGVALEISPYIADVYVDGGYAGRAQQFDGTAQPLTLVPGRHRIELQAAGYAPLIFDVDVLAGQIIPYRGDLQPY